MLCFKIYVKFGLKCFFVKISCPRFWTGTKRKAWCLTLSEASLKNANKFQNHSLICYLFVTRLADKHQLSVAAERNNKVSRLILKPSYESCVLKVIWTCFVFFFNVILISLNFHALVQYKATVFKAVVGQHLRKDKHTFGLFSPSVCVCSFGKCGFQWSNHNWEVYEGKLLLWKYSPTLGYFWFLANWTLI